RVLGPHVAQAGSLVAPDHLRFDGSHGAQVKDREIAQIEELVNEQVQANVEVARMEMDLDEALRMGALALFGEKYGDRVRVVKIGDFSTELCGGTHLERTGELGLVKVTTEGAVASGVRRIEAVAGSAALETVARKEAALREAAEILKIAPLEVPKRLAKLLEEQRLLEKQLAAFEVKLARSRAEELVRAARQVNGVAVVTGRIDGLDADSLRAVADTLRDRLGSGVVCVGSVVDGKVNLVAAVTTDLGKRVQAGRHVLSEYFTSQGHTVDEAANGDEALATIRRDRPDLVLLDIRMPGIDGVEVLRRIRKLDGTLSVIMVTANEDVTLARETLELGA